MLPGIRTGAVIATATLAVAGFGVAAGAGTPAAEPTSVRSPATKPHPSTVGGTPPSGRSKEHRCHGDDPDRGVAAETR